MFVVNINNFDCTQRGTRIRLIDVWAAIGVMLVSSDIGYFPYRYFQSTCVKCDIKHIQAY